MTALAEMRKTIAEEDRKVTNTILRQIGFFTRACLEMRQDNVFSVENGLVASGVIVGPWRKRGNIAITLVSADLYDIKVTRFTNRKGLHTLHHWEGVDGETMKNYLAHLWV